MERSVKKENLKPTKLEEIKKESKYFVEVANGKYTVYQTKRGDIRVLRHGEDWRAVTGDNLIFNMMVELIEAKEKNISHIKDVDESTKTQLGMLNRPEERTCGFHEDQAIDINQRIAGILVGFAHKMKERGDWIDIITTRTAIAEIKKLMKDHKENMI